LTLSFEARVPQELRINTTVGVDYLTKRLRSYIFEYAGCESATIGLSGGVDSAVVAFLAVKALGVNRTHLYFLPSKTTSKEDLEDSQILAETLGVPKGNFRIIPIDGIVDDIVQAAHIAQSDRLGIGNVKARTRMILLHSFARFNKGLVVGTGDKSEITIGYFTKFGDGGVDVLPIGDLYKTQVRQMALEMRLPARVYEKSPSPGLWPGQTAEKELGMDYFLLDQVLFRRFDLWRDEECIASELRIPIKKVRKIVQQVKSTQHKRYPAEIFKLGFRCHGSDWRYPREWA